MTDDPEDESDELVLPPAGPARHAALEELTRDANRYLGSGGHVEDYVDLVEALMGWTKGLAAESEDRDALRCAQAAARIVLAEGGDPDDEEAAQLWVARIAARMGNGGALRTARRALGRLGAMTDELRAELDALSAVAAGRVVPLAPSGPVAFVHPTFGRGELVRKEGDKLRLRFDDGTERVVLASFVGTADD